MAFKFFH